MHKRIVLVEDDQLISEAISYRLRANGYRVSIAADASEAADCLLTEPPDIVLMDINLPDDNGISLAGRMRLLGSTVDVPIIFVTASRDPEYRLRAEALGIQLLEKPLQAAKLLKAIAATLEMSGTQVEQNTLDTAARFERSGSSPRV